MFSSFVDVSHCGSPESKSFRIDSNLFVISSWFFGAMAFYCRFSISFGQLSFCQTDSIDVDKYFSHRTK